MSMKPLNEAVRITKAYRGAGHKPVATVTTFDKNEINQLLTQPGCKGLRIYVGQDGASISLIAVATDTNDTDILTAGSELIAAEAFPCPPMCGGNTALNS